MPLDLDMDMLFKDDPDDHRPEIIITKPPKGFVKRDYEYELKSEKELEEMIMKNTNSIFRFGHKLPDKGQKLRFTIQRCEDELARRLKMKQINKVMYDDGNEEFIDLKMKQWELVENVSATSDSLGQALPTKVSTPQSDEDVWCPKDTKNFQGAATISECRNKRLKMEQDMSKKLTSPQFGTASVQGYKVKNVNAPILESIFKKHGDIAADCIFTIASVRESILEVVCDVVRQIQTNDVTTIISEMAEIESRLSAAEANKINVSWLRAHLESIHKRNNAKKNCSLLMKTKANTSLVTRAAKMDLKTAKERFEKAERCVKVLELVEKKLYDDFLESKAEKDSLSNNQFYWLINSLDV